MPSLLDAPCGAARRARSRHSRKPAMDRAHRLRCRRYARRRRAELRRMGGSSRRRARAPVAPIWPRCGSTSAVPSRRPLTGNFARSRSDPAACRVPRWHEEAWRSRTLRHPRRLTPTQRVEAATLRWFMQTDLEVAPYEYTHNFSFDQLGGTHVRLVNLLTRLHPHRPALGHRHLAVAAGAGRRSARRRPHPRYCGAGSRAAAAALHPRAIAQRQVDGLPQCRPRRGTSS